MTKGNNTFVNNEQCGDFEQCEKVLKRVIAYGMNIHKNNSKDKHGWEGEIYLKDYRTQSDFSNTKEIGI